MNHDATIRARWGRESISAIAASLGVDPRTVARRAAQLGLDLEAGRQAGVKAQHDGGQVWKRDLVSQAVESRRAA